jgi:hypothetical protein
MIVFAFQLARQLKQSAQPAPVGGLAESANTLTVLSPYLIALGVIVVATIVTVTAIKKLRS